MKDRKLKSEDCAGAIHMQEGTLPWFGNIKIQSLLNRKTISKKTSYEYVENENNSIWNYRENKQINLKYYTIQNLDRCIAAYKVYLTITLI